MDFKNSPFVQNKILQNTQEGIFAIRRVFLLRGMLSTCELRKSMEVSWQPIAREAMISHGEAPTSRFRLITKLVINSSLLGLQRRLNLGTGAKVNAVEEYMADNPDGNLDDVALDLGMAVLYSFERDEQEKLRLQFDDEYDLSLYAAESM